MHFFQPKIMNKRSTTTREESTIQATNKHSYLLTTAGGASTNSGCSSQAMSSRYDASASSLVRKLLYELFAKPLTWALHSTQDRYTLGTLLQ
jgi:hypothetical protein